MEKKINIYLRQAQREFVDDSRTQDLDRRGKRGHFRRRR
jgi:hypothetical protein